MPRRAIPVRRIFFVFLEKILDKKEKGLTFALLLRKATATLADGVTVTLQILVLSF
jgi:hypothetical protein